MSDKIAEPLTDNDVNMLMRKINEAYPKVLGPIFVEFSNTLNGILALALEQTRISGDESDISELEQVKRLIGFCAAEEKIIRTKDKIWNVREHIMNKDVDFFLKRDYSGMVKKDNNKAIIESLMEIVKNNFEGLTESEQNKYWKKAKKLLNLVGKFKLAINDL